MLKDIQRIEYPREKLLKYGLTKLTDQELLALIIRTGRRGENVVKLSDKVLNIIKSKGLNNISLKDLLDIKGIGLTKASQILSSIEIVKRLNSSQKVDIINASDVKILMSEYLNSKKEYLIAFLLNSRNVLISKEVISIGTINTTIIHPREVFEPAIKQNATCIIVSHNHPSGDSTPSAEDLEITKNLIKAGDILGIKLLDHVIVSQNSVFSIKDNKAFLF